MTVSIYAGLVFLFRKNSVLTPGVCSPSSFLDPNVKEWLRNSFYPPDPVQAHVWRTVGSSLCLYFCGSSVILRTPLRALGYQVTFVAAALPVEWLIYQAQQHSCLDRIPLQLHAWPGDLWYFGWQTSCLCPAWYFPVKSRQGFSFSKRHYPSSHSFLSPSSAEFLADERSTPSCSEHTNPQATTSLPDSTAFLLRRCLWGPAAGHICISIFTSWKGHFKCTVQLHIVSINTSRRCLGGWASLGWYSLWIFTLLSASFWLLLPRGEKPQWRNLWIVLMGRAHLPFDLVDIYYMKLHGIFFPSSFLEKRFK